MPWNNSIPIIRFQGLRNDLDTVALQNVALKEAINFELDDQGNLHTRDVLSEIGNAEALFVTDDKQAGYVVNDNILYLIDYVYDTLIPILDGIGDAPYHFTNAGRSVFFVTKTDSYVITPEYIQPWGIESPPTPQVFILNSGSLTAGLYKIAYAYKNRVSGIISGTTAINYVTLTDNTAIEIFDVPSIAGHDTILLISLPNGETLYQYSKVTGTTTVSDISSVRHEFHFENCFAPPLTGPLAFWRGSIWNTIYDPTQDYSELYSSIPNSFHHYRLLDAHDIAERGHIRMVAASSVGLIIGTDRNIILYRSIDERIELAQYGVPDGVQWDYDVARNVWFTTHRGIRVIGSGENLFRNPNEDKYLTSWGDFVGVGFVQRNGISQFITAGLKTHVGFRSPLVPQAINLLDHCIEEN